MRMNPEATYLAIVCVLTSCMWIPYIINRIQEMGLWPALKQPQAETPPQTPWAKRAVRAHMNAIENLVIFAPLVLSLITLQARTAHTETLCLLFLILRIAHYLAYMLAVPLVRTLLFAGGWTIQLRLGWLVLEAAQ